MKAKEICISRGASPFIVKVGTSPIPNIERCTLQRHVSVSYAPYKARSQLGQNSGGTRSGLFLPYSYRFFPVLEVPSKNLVVMN
jgi:hypothetical protein